MNPTTLALSIRGAGVLFLIAGGIYALYSGFHIIQNHRDTSARTSFRILGATFTAAGIGAVIMATAGVWAYLGVRMAPNLALEGNGTTKVYAFVTDRDKATVPELAAAASLDPKVVGNSTEELRRVFTESVHADSTSAHLTLKGRSASAASAWAYRASAAPQSRAPSMSEA